MKGKSNIGIYWRIYLVFINEHCKAASVGGVFAGIPIKVKKSESRNQVEAPETVMTFEKFRRTVLPGAKKIELQVSSHKDSYATLYKIDRWD